MSSLNIVVTIGNHHYLLVPDTEALIRPLEGPERFVPGTILNRAVRSLNEAELDKLCDDFARQDDVWARDFLEVLILPHSGILVATGDVQHSYNRDDPLIKDINLPTGPYAIHSSSGRIFRVYRLFEDPNNAFVRGTLPENGTGRHKWLKITDHIAVPSRLCHDRVDEQFPLRGMRFGVKDAIDIAGLETGCGSRCFRSVYPAKDSTAPFVKQLIAAGASMLGRMRLCQFCDGQDPLERIEEVTPTNPRGDTFQKPSASSSGSAAGAASYPWLDFTIGTDTGGSIRHPAGVNGLYGIRPSRGSIHSSGLICADLMDTAGLFARSAKIARNVSRIMTDAAWTSKVPKPGRIKFKLLYAVEPNSPTTSETPKFFSSGGQGAESKTPAGLILEDFVQKLESHLGSNREEVCIYDLWGKTRPHGAPENLIEATDNIYKNIVYGDLAQNVIQPFIRDYQAKIENGGRAPFIEAITKARVDYGARVSREDYDQSVESLKTFADWVNEVLLPFSLADDEAIPMLVYPQSWGRPQYRDEVNKREDGKIFWSGFSAYSISYCSGCPDFTLPVGEVKFLSRFTQTDEYLPVAISLLGPRGTDALLLDLVVELEEKGILRPVNCGSRLWPD